MIIVDTNVIMAFLLTKGITEKIITAHKDVFITPVHCFGEVWKHKGRWNTSGLPDAELKKVVDSVAKLFIYPVPRDAYLQYEGEASKLIDDKDDVPIVALALAVKNDGIWTHDTKHFRKERLAPKVRVLTTRDVLNICPVK